MFQSRDAIDIDAVAPFGCGIKAVDQSEAAAIRSVFGELAANVPLITTIPMMDPRLDSMRISQHQSKTTIVTRRWK